MVSLRSQQLKTSEAQLNGHIFESISLVITSNGTTITASLSATSGTTLTYKFSNGIFPIDVSTPKTISLTVGSDTIPQENWLYVLKTDPSALVVSTSTFPSAEHAPIGRVIVQTAATVQSKGVLKQHNFTDHLSDTNNQGHLSHANEWIREQWATWISGVAPTITGSGTATMSYAVTSGIVRQLHEQAFPAIVNPADVYAINENTTPYTVVTNLGALLTDSIGGSLTNKFYTVVIWGIASKEGAGESKLFINLPSGSYNTLNQATADDSRFSDFGIPVAYKGVGFLIQRIVMRNQSDTTFTAESTEDLRGQFPNTVAGTSIAMGVEFPDSLFRVFDNSDNTKEIAFEVSNLTSATTRTYTWPDRNLTIDNLTTATTIGLTQGSILFAGSSVLAQDNSSLFWDDSTDRLGIGTNTPSEKLDVNGTIKAGQSGVDGINSLDNASDIETVHLDTNGSSFFNGGNVGIGTSTPAKLLHLEQETALTNAVNYVARLDHTTSATPLIGIGVGLEFVQETSVGNKEIIGTIEAVVTDATLGSEDAKLVGKLMAAGASATEVFNCDSLGNFTIAGDLIVGASNALTDSAGTLTLQNVDALDATTESTIEAAIDTLANLTSVQGQTLTMAGSLNVEAASNINQDVTTDATVEFGQIGIGTSTFGASAAGVLGIANGTQGAAAADMIQIVSEDLSAGNTVLSLRTEGTSSSQATGDNVSDGYITIIYNSQTHYILTSSTVPT